MNDTQLTDDQLASVIVFHCECGCSYLQDERFKPVRRKPASIEMEHIDTHVRCYVPLSAFGHTRDEGSTSYVALKYHWKGLEPTQDAINTAIQKRASWAQLGLKDAEPPKEKNEMVDEYHDCTVEAAKLNESIVRQVLALDDTVTKLGDLAAKAEEKWYRGTSGYDSLVGPMWSRVELVKRQLEGLRRAVFAP